MKWCTNDCHDKPMWCGCMNFVNRAEYASNMQKKRDNNNSSSGGAAPPNSRPNISKDFKIALSALMSAEDYASLEEQFFQVKE